MVRQRRYGIAYVAWIDVIGLTTRGRRGPGIALLGYCTQLSRPVCQFLGPLLAV